MPLLTIDEVADIVRLSPRTLYNQRSAGEAPGALGFNIGRAIRWDAAELEAWIDEAKASR